MGGAVVAVDHRGLGMGVDARLGRGVALDRAVAVEMIGRDVEDGRRRQLQRLGGLELEAGQLQHVELGLRVEQVQRRRAEVAADAGAQAGGQRHLADQGGDGALAVAAGDADHRRRGGAGEQLDVAEDRDPGLLQCGDEGIVQRHTRRDHGAGVLRPGPWGVEAAEMELARRHRRAHRLDAGGRGTRIGQHQRRAGARQVARGGGAGLAQSDHQHLASVEGQAHQRTLSVERPTSTRIRVMIQKRTMILGSGQPFSS